MSFPLSLTGLMGASRALDVIGNNIANSQTVGFKSSKVQFGDVFTSALNRGESSQGTGEGTSADKVWQNFLQGSFQATSNPLDVAVSGKGFFRLQDGTDITYTRDGQFTTNISPGADNLINLVTGNNVSVTGYNMSYGADPQGIAQAVNPPVPLKFQVFMPGQASASVGVAVNLDAGAAIPALSPFNSAAANTYNHSASIPVYGTGQPQSITTFTDQAYAAADYEHNLTLYWVRSDPVATPNTWQVYSQLSYTDPTTKLPAQLANPTPITVEFDTKGQLKTPAALAQQSFDLPDGRTVGPLTVDFAGSTQYGSQFQTYNVKSGEGYLGGMLDATNGIYVEDNGEIWGNYSNGQHRRVGQLVLSNFTNVDALIRTGDGQWMKNNDPVMGTGKESIGLPGGGRGRDQLGMGAVSGGTVELSNVDLNVELVGLIEQQRFYQANAQTFKIQDEVLQNLANTIR